MITRRLFIGLAVMALAPPAAFSQSRDGERRLGVLLVERPDDQTRTTALLDGLAALGWHEGYNLHIDWRFTGGDPALYDSYAAELVALAPEVIVTGGTPAVTALRRQTTTIPIVFSTLADPVGQGLVESLARPGGHMTGFTDIYPPMTSKRLGMLKQIAPPIERVAVLYNPATAPLVGPTMQMLEQQGPSLDLTVRAAPIRDDAEIDTAITALANEQHGGILVLPDGFTTVHRKTIVGLAARYRIPAVYWNVLFMNDGGLMAYGVDYIDLMRRAADYVDRILKGASPADLPVQNPTKFLKMLNLKTAREIGVTFAPELLAAASEVIE
jgi:putative tryptophan/tyrosine transport system substrate-binding protein